MQQKTRAIEVVHGRAPMRISLAGGGTDVSPYTEQFGGAVVNFAISRYAYAELQLYPEPQLLFLSRDTQEQDVVAGIKELRNNGALDMLKAVTRAMHRYECGIKLAISSGVPPRSGLGGSASLFVATIATFNYLEREYRRDLHEVAELAWHIERDELKNLGGRQDQYAAAFGGVNFIEFKGNDFVLVNPLKLPSGIPFELERRLLLFYIGDRAQGSGAIIEKQIEAIVAGRNLDALHRTKALALEMKYALIRGNFDQVGHLLHRAWQEKKRFTDRISDPRIDQIYGRLRQAGALGGKLTGAGGGGHMVIYAPLDRQPAIFEQARQLGLTHVPYTIDFTGLQTWSPQES